MSNGVDPNAAKQIVRDFLAQAHEVHTVGEPVLDDHSWKVEADVTSFGVNQIKKVKVDAATGRIMGYESRFNFKSNDRKS